MQKLRHSMICFKLHRDLYGCSNQTELSNAIRLMSIKSYYNIPQNYFNEVMQLMVESCLADVEVHNPPWIYPSFVT